MSLLLIFAFISGLVTILAPCIWPLLPIILSTSLGGGKAKSLGITLGIMVSFAVFTLSISYLVNLFGFDPNSLRLFAVIILVILGLMMIIPAFGRLIEAWVSRLSGSFGANTTQRSGFWGGLLTGGTLGIIWTPCAGPILAAIATIAATSQVTSGTVLVTIAYVLGVGIPLFFFSYGGQKLIADTRALSPYTERIQQVFGILLLLTAILIYTNYDRVLQAKLLDLFPQYSSALTAFESNPAVKQELDKLKNSNGGFLSPQNGGSTLPVLGDAPEFTGITSWLNSKPLTMQDLRGKVVLIDFWTYTCINCIRTLPYITTWYDKYKDDGLVVVGVHTPEFEIEKSTKNVADAIKMYGISYPVAQDNNFMTWSAYNNQYWPAKYLIDTNGKVRYTHFGEGEYDVTEKAIQALLKEKGINKEKPLVSLDDQTPKGNMTPETYLGTGRIAFFGSNEPIKGGAQSFTYQSPLPENFFAYGGTWDVGKEHATAIKKATLELQFVGSKVFLVMTPKTKNDTVKVFLDGKPISADQAGKDVKNGIVSVTMPRLYELVNLHDRGGAHVLKLEFVTPGTQVFAFTFG